MSRLYKRRAMDSDMLQIHPRELTFVFELHKQSLDSVQLYNNSEEYVAFKVKTTSPKKYCVRPNIGVIKPKSTCTFTVTMQPQREAPPYMQCKDKFLIQSTYVPHGIKDEEVTSDQFIKGNGKYIEEKKLRVVLISAGPDVIPTNEVSEKEPAEKTRTLGDQASNGLDKPLRALPELIYENGGLKYPADTGASVAEPNETVKVSSEPTVVKIPPGTIIEEEEPPKTYILEKPVETEVTKDAVDASYAQATVETNNVATTLHENTDSDELKDMSAKRHQNVESKPFNNTAMSSNEVLKVALNVSENEEELTIKDKTCRNSENDIDALRLKLEDLNSQLNEAKYRIAKLADEQNKATTEKEILKQELAVLRKGTCVSSTGQVKVYDGFPLLFVCVVAIVSLACGYLLRT